MKFPAEAKLTGSTHVFDELRGHPFLRPVPVVGPARIAHANLGAGVPERRQLQNEKASKPPSYIVRYWQS